MACVDHDNSGKAGSVESAAAAESGSRRPRILVAEDNPSNYKLVEVLLRRDYDLAHAWDGAQAVELFREAGADLVLMDISMPVMDGYRALREIREIDPSILVIAVSAYAFESDRQRMFEAGFDACLSKPLSPGDLPKRVAEFLQKKKI